jgi:hypothetical protein
MSWRAQNRSKDAKTPSAAGVWSKKPELDYCPVQPYFKWGYLMVYFLSFLRSVEVVVL